MTTPVPPHLSDEERALTHDDLLALVSEYGIACRRAREEAGIAATSTETPHA